MVSEFTSQSSSLGSIPGIGTLRCVFEQGMLLEDEISAGLMGH